jgi:hypothetical protein
MRAAVRLFLLKKHGRSVAYIQQSLRFRILFAASIHGGTVFGNAAVSVNALRARDDVFHFFSCDCEIHPRRKSLPKKQHNTYLKQLKK